ncbi:MAG TPA: phosphoribosyltransferase family protein [Terriglobales bacterium]|nr:phosphoribosyltransferase family protein [Terriglobales bacterium]
MRFDDRAHAGRELARRLADVRPRPCVVGAIPRGGVAVGLPLAEALAIPLVAVNAHKLTSEFAPEFAFGAIDEDGEVLLDPASVAQLGLGPGEIGAARRAAWACMRTRIERPREARLAAWLPGAAVLVDDGLATGLTMQAAVRYARRHGAFPIVVAAPCASAEAARALESEADRFVCPVVDPEFDAVGSYYVDFSQLTDEETDALLARAARDREVPPAGASAGRES